MKKFYFDRVAREKILSVRKKNLDSAYRKIKADWEKHLVTCGIKMPTENTAKWYQLTVLKHLQGKAAHKNDVSELISKLTNTAATDQQIRHLKTQGGWFVLNRGDSYVIDGKTFHTPEGCHVLITTKEPFPNSALQRRTIITRGTWDTLLKQYGNKCASCGTKIGEYHRFDSAYKVEVLEKGHMNPNKPLVAGNVIPQCRWCNRTARGDFTFDEQGRPRAVATVRPIRRADEGVIDAIEEWIRDRKKPDR